MHYTNLCSLFDQEPPSDNELKNLAILLYNGFCCSEALTERNLDDVIGGICGVAGEVYLGDGNEKNCCSTSEVVFSSFFFFLIDKVYYFMSLYR